MLTASVPDAKAALHISLERRWKDEFPRRAATTPLLHSSRISCFFKDHPATMPLSMSEARAFNVDAHASPPDAEL